MSDKPLVHQPPKAEDFIYRSLGAEFEQGGHLRLTSGENSIGGNIATIKRLLQSAPLHLHPNDQLEFTLRYHALTAAEESINLEVAVSHWSPEVDDQNRSLDEIALDLIERARAKFIQALANQQITLDGPFGALKDTEVA